MSVDTVRLAEGRRDAGIVASDRVLGIPGQYKTTQQNEFIHLPRDEITTSNQAQQGQDSRNIQTESKYSLLSISGLSERGDTRAIEVSVIGHRVQSRAEASDVRRSRGDEFVRIVAFGGDESETLWLRRRDINCLL